MASSVRLPFGTFTRTSFPHDAGRLLLKETHLSWVILTGKRAYKIKKAVDFGFADARRLEDRERLCRREIEVNAALAGDLFRGVVAITERNGTLHVTPADAAAADDWAGGRPVEWAVEMTQFPAERLMSARLAGGRVTADEARALGRQVAAWHADADRADPPCDPVGWNRRVLEATLDALRQRLAPAGRGRVDALGRWADAFLRNHADAFARRAKQGRYRLCHGDLHWDNLLWAPDGFRAFDALEFDDDLRRTDVAADLAFAVSDCAARGRVDLSRSVLGAYLEASGDYEALAVLRFHLVGRAAVRALAHALHPREAAGTATEPGVDEYLAEAARGAEGDPPALAITHGVSGSGKTTAARRFAAETGAVWVRSDTERTRLPHVPDGSAEYRYSDSRTGLTYGRLRLLAADALCAGWPVVVDATFLTEDRRRMFSDLAGRMDLPFRILDCDVSPIEAAERITNRLSADANESEATLGVLAEQLETAEPLTPAELATVRPAGRTRPDAAGSDEAGSGQAAGGDAESEVMPQVGPGSRAGLGTPCGEVASAAGGDRPDPGPLHDARDNRPSFKPYP